MKSVLLLLGALLFGSLNAQDCSDGRFLVESFGLQIEEDITYGSNINLFGLNQSLEMDIYQPQGDTAALRPLIVWEHGGSFVAGSKDGVDLVALMEPLTRMGYVNASVEYRLGIEGIPIPGPDMQTGSEAVLRAVADFKAAVRWWYKSAREGNPYRIDTNRIFAGGVSAGGVAAAHLAYVDKVSEIPAAIDTTKPGLGGGVEGLSGNPGYPSRIAGVINICGMLADTIYMEPGDVPIVSLHGTEDDVVPYGYDEIVVGIWTIMFVHGSASMHTRAANLGMEHCFYPHPGAGHTPHVLNQEYTDTTLNVVKHFLLDKVCPGAASQCGFLVTGGETASFSGNALSLYPNPAHQQFTLRLESPGSWEWEVVNPLGQRMAEGKSATQTEEIDGGNWPKGIYWVRIRQGEQQMVRKLILE